MTSRSLYVALAVVATGFACGGQALVSTGSGSTDAGGAASVDAGLAPDANDASPTPFDAGPQATDDAACTGAPFACGVAGSGVAITCVAGCQYCAGVNGVYSCPRVPAACGQDPTCSCLDQIAFVPSTSSSSGPGPGGFMVSCKDVDGGGVVLAAQEE